MGRHHNRFLRRNIQGTGGPVGVVNDEKEIWELSKKHRKLQTLMHYVNTDSLMREHTLQCGKKASGVDRVTKGEYGQQLESKRFINPT